jgi:cytochrome c biogenesis protein ResB
MLGFGPKIYFTQPFALKLEKFVMETYPGSSSPSAYESHVRIVDEGRNALQYLYMNHVLNYKGYRFFQGVLTRTEKVPFFLSTTISGEL